MGERRAGHMKKRKISRNGCSAGEGRLGRVEGGGKRSKKGYRNEKMECGSVLDYLDHREEGKIPIASRWPRKKRGKEWKRNQ